MKNIEIKVKLSKKRFQEIKSHFEKQYLIVDTLNQTDTYYVIKDGRLKIREQTSQSGKQNRIYAIRYYRPNTAEGKISVFYCNEILDLKNFKLVFGDLLEETVKVVKERYLCNTVTERIHLDYIENLGYFLEIEVVVVGDIDNELRKNVFNNLMTELDLENSEKINIGYRELLLEKTIKTTKVFYWLHF